MEESLLLPGNGYTCLVSLMDSLIKLANQMCLNGHVNMQSPYELSNILVEMCMTDSLRLIHRHVGKACLVLSALVIEHHLLPLLSQ